MLPYVIGHLHNNICYERSQETMAKRASMTRKKDKVVYTQTANKVKKINIKPKLSRGGIRL